MRNMFKIIGDEGNFPEFQQFHDLGSKFLPYAHKKLGFNKPVEVNLLSDPENAKNPLGKTAYYDPNQMKITLFVDKRHVKDILRSMAHELVHHTQNCRGEFDGGVETGPGYAQEDGHMRKMEEEAYLEGQMLLRDWEDGVKKGKQKMSLKENIKIIINEAKPGDIVPSRRVQSWLDKQMAKLGKEKEEESEEEEEERRVSSALNDPGLKLARDHAREQEGYFDLEENNNMSIKEKEELEEAEASPCDDRGDCPDGQLCVRGICVDAENPDPTNENWLKGNKDQLLFERLMEKWVK